MAWHDPLDRLHAAVCGQPWLRGFTAFTRVILGLTFLYPGLVKVLGLPFTKLPPSHPVGAFFAVFYALGGWYRLVGWAQVIAGLLLLVPRTAPLGAALFLPIIVNIHAITVSGGFVGTPAITGLMLLGSVYLIAWDWRRWRLFLVREAAPAGGGTQAGKLLKGALLAGGVAAAFAALFVAKGVGGSYGRRLVLPGLAAACAFGALVRWHAGRIPSPVEPGR